MNASSRESPRGRPHVEFLLCGSPNHAFYSQMAFFRLSLDWLGGSWRQARVVAVFGAEQTPPLPARWEPHFERIEVIHAAPEDFHRKRYFAANDLRFELLDPRADLSCLCDADTAFLRPLPPELIRKAREHPELLGVMAHFPFPVSRDSRGELGERGLYPDMPHELAWDRVGELVYGRAPARSEHYTMGERWTDDSCPFYINYGFLAGSPDLLGRLHREIVGIHEPIGELLGNDFYGQVAIALAVDQLGLPARSLPLRFNFPNDRQADRLHPEELRNVVLLHYLRTPIFDRHQVFAREEAFRRFLETEMEGSDQVFREHVLALTGGAYPFPGEEGEQ